MANTEHTFGKFKRISEAEAKRDAAASRVSSPEGKPVLVPRGEKVIPDSWAYQALFNLQEELEKEKPMDYHEYAAKLWEKITGQEPDTLRASFRTFEGSIIARLHDIPMRSLVYEDVKTSMGPLLQKYQDSVKMISLWSKGDVAATGYQVGKIESSQVVQDFMREVLAQSGVAGGKKLLREKMRYDVADDKMKGLVAYVGEQLPKTEGIMKLVIIEDSRKNLGEVKKAIEQTLGEEVAARVEVVPIWAAYSREGTKAYKDSQVKGSEQDFLARKQELNGINSFKDLLDAKRFGEKFKGAYVFVDFDGVIGDNLQLRNEQANAILSACVDGLAQEWGKSREQTASEILSRLGNKP